MSEKTVEGLDQSIHDLHESPTGITTTVEEPSTEASIRDILLQIRQIQEESSRDHLSQMRQLLAQEEMGANLSIKPFDWMTCKPEKLFYPDWWIQSLEDTPEVYQAKQTKNVPLRKDIRRYLSSRHCRAVIEDPEYTVANINSKLAAEDLQFVSVFELFLTRRFTFTSEKLSIAALMSDSQHGSLAAIRSSYAANE